MLRLGLLLAAAAGISMLSGPALADEPDQKTGAWSGCYIGATVGYKWGTSRQTYGGERAGVPDTFLPVGFDVTGDYDVEGRLGGGEVGCNYRFDRWMMGVVVDLSGANAKGLAGPTPGAIAAGSNALRRFHTDEHWLATLRGRFGFVTGRSLWYVTAGGAWTGLDVNNEAALVSPIGNRAPTRVERFGWVVGAGTEYALDSRWTVKGEFLYADFGTFHYTDTPIANGCVQCYSMNVDLSEWIVRVGLSYRFTGL